MSRRKEPTILHELLDQLLAGGDASAAFDQGGSLDSRKKALTERALKAERDHHLSGEDGVGNTRNGYGRKTVMTDTGKMSTEVPRDRQASFDPQLIAKYQRCFPSLDQQIVWMFACGMINTIAADRGSSARRRLATIGVSKNESSTARITGMSTDRPKYSPEVAIAAIAQGTNWSMPRQEKVR